LHAWMRCVRVIFSKDISLLLLFENSIEGCPVFDNPLPRKVTCTK
jgi:hypothetical protein